MTEPQELLKKAAASRKAKEFLAAVDLYSRVLAFDPTHPQALKGLADAYRGLRDARHCLLTWDRYLALCPGDGSVQTRVGDACRRLGLGTRAEDHYQAALRHNPQDRYALMGLGDLHQSGGRLNAALVCWEGLLQLAPGLLNIRTMAGNAYRKQLDFTRAEAHFREVLHLEPGNAHAIFGLADALRGQGRFMEAAGHWEVMLRLDPDNQQVLARAGDCFARLGDLDRAEAILQQALTTGDNKPALLGLAKVLLLRADPLAAIQCYERILAKHPGDPRAGLLLSQAKAGLQSPSVGQGIPTARD
jgi:tetratricopeptide (TPR) repeat protein